MALSLRSIIGHSAIAVAALTVSVSANAQGLTSMGLDYWMGFMPNWLPPAENLRIFIASPTPNLVDVETFRGSDKPTHTLVAMEGGTVATVDLPDPGTVEERNPEVPEYHSVHLRALAPIAVYGLSNSTYTSDGYLALPRHALDQEYYSACFYDDHYSRSSVDNAPLAGEFLIVAPHDGTVITIHNVKADTRTGTIDYAGPDSVGQVDVSHLRPSHKIGDTWSITLNHGQTYLVQSSGLGYGEQDLTGTLVTGTKPFSFLSGHQRASIPIGAINDSKDHLIEMIPPTNRWGTRYFDQPTSYRIGGDKIRLIAGEDGETIKANGSIVGVLNQAGDWVDVDRVDVPTVFTSDDQRFLAVQYTYTQMENNDTAQTDPTMIVLPSEQQFQRHIFFRTPPNLSFDGSPYTHYLTVVGPLATLNSVEINERKMTEFEDAKMTTFDGYQVGSITCKLPQGDRTYVIESKDPVGAWASGTSYVDSYGWPVGMLLNLPSDDLLSPMAGVDRRDAGSLALTVTDAAANNTKSAGIAEVELIANAGDARYAKGSTNVKLESTQDLVSGSSQYSCKLSLVDPTMPGDAGLWVIDKSGNATVQSYHIPAGSSGVGGGSAQKPSLSVMPNPASSRVSVVMPSSASVESMDLYDMTGKKMKAFGAETTLDVSDVANGTYSLQITTAEKIATAKLVVSH